MYSEIWKNNQIVEFCCWPIWSSLSLLAITTNALDKMQKVSTWEPWEFTKHRQIGEGKQNLKKWPVQKCISIFPL